ncbi:hypothetical protein BKA65DRAFT_105078 [Rhexocercosporidium sp. MPI-PUGE-AT-0058]|nr:hypothetical protein BKA65DRAFT_105078 [Rhexocercosporidium sp. MPI-PUGE-AT-0058]
MVLDIDIRSKAGYLLASPTNSMQACVSSQQPATRPRQAANYLPPQVLPMYIHKTQHNTQTTHRSIKCIFSFSLFFLNSNPGSGSMTGFFAAGLAILGRVYVLSLLHTRTQKNMRRGGGVEFFLFSVWAGGGRLEGGEGMEGTILATLQSSS